MKTAIATAVAATLLAGPVLIATPAEAVNVDGVIIKTCAKTKYGTEVRIRMRFEGNKLKIRVSHPDGENRFENDKVARVVTYVDGGGITPPPNPDGSQIGGGAWRLKPSDEPRIVARSSAYNYVQSVFKLRNGHTIKLMCSKHFA